LLFASNRDRLVRHGREGRQKPLDAHHVPEIFIDQFLAGETPQGMIFQ
jgi:hypothetical protein